MGKLFFMADEHYGHANILKFCNRPYETVHEMNKDIIQRHNSVVSSNDTVIHAGDFTLNRNAQKYIDRLNGSHIFLRGSHDYWLPKTHGMIWEGNISNNNFTVICHYCMRTWARSHFNSFHLYGHSHGRLAPIGKSWDIGVDNNNFYPLSVQDVIKIMDDRPNNPNYIRKEY
jgi:calcineurin-like phosphoesterase family protein